MQPTIFTVGHSRLTFMQFHALLQKHQIMHIVDIRSIPYSRHAPWSNKSRLPEMLKPFNIQYAYLGHILGGKKPTFGKAIELEPEADITLYNETIETLLQLSLKGNLCLLCAEGDPAKCHRQHKIAQALLQSDAKVFHILTNGNLKAAWKEEPETRQTTLF